VSDEWFGEFIPIGHGGTRVDRKPAVVTVLRSEEDKTFVRITQTIKLSVEVPIMRPLDSEHWCCACGERPPLPDADAAEFIIANHDHERLVVPAAEDTRQERDRYPVKGWTDVDGKLTCPTCTKELNDAIAAVKARQKAKKKP
jgi:hypothetical protein